MLFRMKKKIAAKLRELGGRYDEGVANRPWELILERNSDFTRKLFEDPESVELFKKGVADSEDLYFELRQIKAKTMLLWGQDDRAGALDVGLLMLRLIPDARLYLFHHCGHWAQVEHRDEFNRVAVQFFQDDAH